MSFRELLKRGNTVHLKILMAFLGLVILFAVTQTVVSTRRMSRDVEAQTTHLLQAHTRLFNEVIKEQEAKVAFYAQFMADVTKLSDELADTSVGRSVLIYLLDSLKKDRVRIRLYRELTRDEGKKRLIRKGLLGIRTTALVKGSTMGKAELSIAAVAPIERAGGIREVIIAEYPLDLQFLKEVKRKTGADFMIIHEGKVFSSTVSISTEANPLFGILDEGVMREISIRGSIVVREISDTRDPTKIAFGPLSINFKNQAIYAVSESLKQVLISKKRILLQNAMITLVILIGLVLIYYVIVRRITHPLKELSLASRKVAEGNLGVNVEVKTKDEVGELGESFNRMVGQLRESQEEVKRRMDELSLLYQRVSQERNISKSILDNLTSGVILFDPDQRVVLMNPTAQKWLGVKEEEIQGMQIAGKPGDPSLEPLYRLARLQPIEDMICCWKYFTCNKEKCPAYGSDDRRCWFVSGTYCRNEIAEKFPEKLEVCKECDVYETFRQALERQKEVRFEEVELIEPQRRILKVSLSPIFDEHRKFLGLINVFSDVTAEKEIDRLKTEFVSLVSHELRTPLSSIKAYAEILLKNPEREKDQQVEFLNIINEETDRLTRLINDILNITKIEERRIDLQREAIEIREIIHKSISALRSYAIQRNIKMRMDVQKDIPRIWGHDDTLTQVLANLLNNAVKYTPGGGKIHVSARHLQQDSRDRGEVEVRVKDTGVGIPSEHLERVFDRFYRIERPFVGDDTGTGLGLYFCKYIIERHGGRIWAESEEGKGTTFVFSLPAGGEGERRPDPLDDNQPEQLVHYPKHLRRKTSVLVVDDEKRIRDFLRHHLQEEGFTVYEAENGSNALELAKDRRPNLILLDAVMPGMDGYEVLETLKADESIRDLPVIVLSGSEDSRAATALGATSYLVKPVERKTLIRAVEEALGRSITNKKGRAGSEALKSP